jgi:hypothetical protein
MRVSRRSRIGYSGTGGGGGARRARKIVILRTHRGLRACARVMIMIKSLHRHCNDREDNREGEGEEKCNGASSRLPAEFHQAEEGHAASGLYHTVSEHYLVLANLSDRGKRGFTIFKTDGRR